jgi:hypothetical protein
MACLVQACGGWKSGWGRKAATSCVRPSSCSSNPRAPATRTRRTSCFLPLVEGAFRPFGPASMAALATRWSSASRAVTPTCEHHPSSVRYSWAPRGRRCCRRRQVCGRDILDPRREDALGHCGLLRQFGWCTWELDAFYQDVTQEGVEGSRRGSAACSLIPCSTA